MSMQITCTGCGAEMTVSAHSVGKPVQCPDCGQVISIKPSSDQEDKSVGYRVQASGRNDPRDQEHQASVRPGDHDSPQSHHSETPSQFWLRADDGKIYGPVDRLTLDKWFAEGRVGRDYSIRTEVHGRWYPAADFLPGGPPTIGIQEDRSVPLAESTASPDELPPEETGDTTYIKPDPSPLVLTMGILAWVTSLLCAPIGLAFAIVAVVSGRAALNEIASGIADPKNVALVQVGYYLGWAFLLIVAAVIVVFCFVLLVMAGIYAWSWQSLA